jgi:hypothetical protein
MDDGRVTDSHGQEYMRKIEGHFPACLEKYAGRELFEALVKSTGPSLRSYYGDSDSEDDDDDDDEEEEEMTGGDKKKNKRRGIQCKRKRVEPACVVVQKVSQKAPRLSSLVWRLSGAKLKDVSKLSQKFARLQCERYRKGR